MTANAERLAALEGDIERAAKARNARARGGRLACRPRLTSTP